MHYAGRVTGGTIEGTVSGGRTGDVERDAPMRMVAGLLLLAGIWRPPPPPGADADHRFLYVAAPGIRNYVEHGGIGILVFDIEAGYRFVRRIPTFEVPAGSAPENIKGIAAHAGTSRLYLTTPLRVAAFDLTTDRLVWNRQYPGGADRLALSPDGRLLYVPSFEGPHWHAVDAATGDIIAKVVTESGAHNTIYGPDGRHVYLAGLKSPTLNIADPATHTVTARVGPFSHSIRPFTINAAQTRVYVNVNELLGFEVGDITTGRVLHRVEVTGLPEGPGETPRLPEPRHWPDARRARDLADRRRQQQAARLRQHRWRRRNRSPACRCATSRAGSPSAWTGATPIRRPARSSTRPPGK